MPEDQIGAIALGAAASALGPLVWWVTRQAATGRLHKNMWIGIRTPRTLRSEQAWVAGHRAALEPTRRTAGVAALLGVVAVALALADRASSALVPGLGSIAVVLVGAVVAVRAAHREIG